MSKNLLSLIAFSLLCLLSFSSCDGETASAPPDRASSNPIITQLRGNWVCTYVEERVYSNDTGQTLRITEGANDDVFTFANSYYQKKSSPFRYFVYGAYRGGGGKMFLNLEEYDKYYSVEITTLNTTSMVWKITFNGNNAKAIKYMYFKR